MANIFGKLGYSGNIKPNPQVGPGESEVDILQKATQATYCDENGNPFNKTFYDGANPIDWQSRIVRDNPNGAGNVK